MKIEIKKAIRQQRKFKGAIIAPSGGGKTYTALNLMRALVGKDGKILVADTERSSATLYSEVTEFDHAEVTDFGYESFLAIIAEASKLKYDGLIIDSVSHAWEGFLEMHEQESARARNSFTAWSKITPLYNQLIQAIVGFSGHIIVTMRAKTDYVIEKNEKGKDAPKKVGLAPVMRPGSEYEFDVVATMDLEHNMMIEKSRIDWLADKIVKKPKPELGQKIAEWLNQGAVAEPKVLGLKTADELQKEKAEIDAKFKGDDIPDFKKAEEIGDYHYNLGSVLAEASEEDKAKKLKFISKNFGIEIADGIYAFNKIIMPLEKYRAN